MRTIRRLHQTAAVLIVVAVCLSELTSSVAQAHVASTHDHSSAVKRDGSSYSVRWMTGSAEERTATVQVSGISAATLKALQGPAWISADWKRVLAIYAEPGDSGPASDLPPMLGRYRIHSGLLSFEPQFPLDRGVIYRAVFRPDELPGLRNGEKSGPMVAVFRLPPARPVRTTVIQRIFPSSESLPENLLKFYVYFSAPMSRGRIYEHIHLRNDAGKEIELPFLEIDEELWDPTMTRLTLFIDPGRIKRGVLPLEEIGPALETGKRYSLAIDSGWKDGAGNPLQEGFEKHFSVGPPDRDPPDPSRWKIKAPLPGTRAPLTVSFPEPMDHALAQRVIQVVADSGEALAGSVTLGDQERQWEFAPANSWLPGVYHLVVPTSLEDLAGNNIGKPFEVDLFEGVQRRHVTPTVKLPFDVR